MTTPRIGKAPQQFNKRTTVRQTCKAEQWHGIKAPRSIHVTNNFYGMQGTYRGWNNDAWALYDKHHSNYNMVETFSLIGMLATCIGGLFDALGIGKKNQNDEAGQIDPPAQKPPENQENQNTHVEVEDSEQNSEEEPAKTSGWSGLTISAMDEEVDGKSPTTPIKGTIGDVVENSDNPKFPESFAITDSGSKYVFELVTGKYHDANKEQPIYKCTSGPVSKKYSQGNEYAAVFDQEGKPSKLIQYKDMAGYGVNVGKLNNGSEGNHTFYGEDGTEYTEASS